MKRRGPPAYALPPDVDSVRLFYIRVKIEHGYCMHLSCTDKTENGRKVCEKHRKYNKAYSKRETERRRVLRKLMDECPE